MAVEQILDFFHVAPRLAFRGGPPIPSTAYARVWHEFSGSSAAFAFQNENCTAFSFRLLEPISRYLYVADPAWVVAGSWVALKSDLSLVPGVLFPCPWGGLDAALNPVESTWSAIPATRIWMSIWMSKTTNMPCACCASGLDATASRSWRIRRLAGKLFGF
jgi:hypothetical protein